MQITKKAITEKITTYTITDPPLRLLAWLRLQRIRKNKTTIINQKHKIMLTKKQIELDRKKVKVFNYFTEMMKSHKKMKSIDLTAKHFDVVVNTVRNYIAEVEANKEYFDKMQ